MGNGKFVDLLIDVSERLVMDWVEYKVSGDVGFDRNIYALLDGLYDESRPVTVREFFDYCTSNSRSDQEHFMMLESLSCRLGELVFDYT